jgi:nitrite reductase/ring-hydroxylating ferredoxin subunit
MAPFLGNFKYTSTFLNWIIGSHLFIPLGSVKGWEFGEKQTVACANVDGNFYALQGSCPRCAFDLFKGDIVTDEAFGPDQPRLACPTCATTFSLKTGKHGAALKRTGLAGFVGGLAKTATVNDASADAKAFVITREKESGRVFCKER